MRSVCAAQGLLLQDGADGPSGRRADVCGPGDPGLLERWLEPIAYESVEHVLRLPDIGDHVAGPLPGCDVELASGRVPIPPYRIQSTYCE